MINTAEVFLWGTRIGIIHKDNNKPYVSFEYDRNFLKSEIEVSPLRMRLSESVYEFPELVGSAFHGAPGLVADSLPDKFGNKIIDMWLEQQGYSLNDFNVIDRLCYTGSRGMGALEYVPAQSIVPNIGEDINIDKMVDFASKMLSDRKEKTIKYEDDLGYSQLVSLGTSAGGARAKALIAWNENKKCIKSGQVEAGDGYEYWLMKFDGVSKNGDHDLVDKPEYTKIEYAYYLLALEAGINMEECRLFEENGRYHFMTKRFDRRKTGKVHMQTFGALAHIDYNIPGVSSYEQVAESMKRLDISMKEVEQLFRRMIFNVVFVNQDDHVKNVSFLMDRKGKWSLSPAYDITFAFDADNQWLKEHQMCINGKAKDIVFDDLLSAGKNMRISKSKCISIIEEVQHASNKLKENFEIAGVSEKNYEEIRKIINRHSVI